MSDNPLNWSLEEAFNKGFEKHGLNKGLGLKTNRAALNEAIPFELKMRGVDSSLMKRFVDGWNAASECRRHLPW